MLHAGAPAPGHEHRRARRGPPGHRRRARRARRPARLHRPGRRRRVRDGLDERQRLGADGRRRTGHLARRRPQARTSTPSPGRSSSTTSTGCSSSAAGRPTTSAHRLFEERTNYPAFDIPIVCLPATIDNNLPGTELSIGADTALNNIVDVVDKIKQSAVAEQRCYVVEVMGRRCGYLALMSGLATGAERVYLHEEGVTLKTLRGRSRRARAGLQAGQAPRA